MLSIKTQRLMLRQPVVDDAVRMQRILENLEVAKNLSRVQHPYPKRSAEGYIERIKSETDNYNLKFAIVDRDEQFCGMAGFTRVDDVPQLGYYLDPLHWGKGYMTEACVAALNWQFSVETPEYVKSGVFVSNPASLAIQNKLGFTEVGRSTIHCLAQSADFEHIDTQLTKDAFVQATQ